VCNTRFLESGRARRTRRPARPLRSLTPLESPFSRRPVPGQGWWAALGRCSPGLVPSKACSGIPRVRSSRERTWSGANPCPVRPREPSDLATSFARLELRPWGLEPTVRQRVRSIKPLTPPSGSDPAGERYREALARQPLASPLRNRAEGLSSPSLATVRDVLPAPPLGGAPHLPRPFPRPPRGRARRNLGGARFRSASRSAPF